MSSPASTTADAGRMIGRRYRLRSALGSGGMGTVWLAEDELLGRAVAVKEVQLPPGLPEHEQAELRRRLLREARVAARLSHPSAVTVYDVVEEDGWPYIVMEFVRARTLDDVITNDGPLVPPRAAQVALHVLGALEAAHAVGIVHRDVKPGNIMLGESDRVTLTDFGIATSSGESSITSTGLLLGSPSYIAPERARGRQPGPASDLWSLGATLYTAVEGHAPFERGDPFLTLAAVTSEDHAPFRLAGPLAPIIDGLLVRDPERRWHAAQARAALGTVAAQAQPGAPGTGPGPGADGGASEPGGHAVALPWSAVLAAADADSPPAADPSISPAPASAPAAASAAAADPSISPAPVSAPAAASAAAAGPAADPAAPADPSTSPASASAPAAAPAAAPADGGGPPAAVSRPEDDNHSPGGATGERVVETGEAATAAAAARPAAAPARSHPAPPAPEPVPPPRPGPSRLPDTQVGRTRRRVGVPVLVGVLALLLAAALAFNALDRRPPAGQAEVAADATPGAAAGDPAAAGAEPTAAEAAAPAEGDAAAEDDGAGNGDEAEGDGGGGDDGENSGQGDGGNSGRGNGEGDQQGGQEQAAEGSGGVEVPADFVTFTSPDGGWSIRHPPGWTVQDRANTPLDLVEPGTGRYLRVDYRRPPGESALGAWQDYEPAYAANHSGYRQIRMEEVAYRGFETADWEYTYTSGGATLHAVNRGFIARGDGILESGYALNFQTRDADWERSRELFEQLAASFQPAPAP